MGGGSILAGLFAWPDSIWTLLYIAGELLAAILMAGVASYTWRNQNSPEALALVVVGSGVSLWNISSTVQILTTSYLLTRVGMQLSYVGITCSVTGWLLFFLAFTDRTELLTRKLVAALSVHPLLFALLGVTNDPTILASLNIVGDEFGHYLIWSDLEPTSTVFGIRTRFGILWWVHVLYSYILLFYSTFILVGYFFRHRSVYRSQVGVIMIAIGISWVANVSAVLQLTRYDFTPLSYCLVGLAFFWSMFKHDLMDLTPIARRTAWDELDDAVVTLDDEDRVVDANETAKEMFEVEEECEGMPASVFFDAVPDATLQRLADADDIETEITATIGDERRYFSLSISPIDSERDQPGRVLVFQDITDLKQREQELDVLRQVQSRVLRHNIRTELSMMRGHAQMISSIEDTADQQHMDSILSAGDRLATISDKARVVEELFEDEQSPREYDIRGSVDQAVASIRGEYPELSVSVTGADECQARASPHLQTAVENLLENAAEHNDSDQPEATVHLKNGSSKELTVSDNGPGIPEQELTVLEKEGEDALEHGSGLGLWLVKWIADRSDADLAFETGAEGTAVSIQFS